MEISVLKNKLKDELSKNKPDNDLIISLSHEIANSNQNKVRFSIDAGVINRLGKELVGRQETAVSELVKNSYDADATEVNLNFIDTDTVGGSLQIIDNGVGMTRDELINGFMKISSTTKLHNPISSNFKRKRAGQKGIGRFSVQRLGKQLTIVTQNENENFALKLLIDWDEYQNDINLLSISNTLEVIEKEQNAGTTLYIDNLRDKWTLASIKRIYSYVLDILQPFPLSKISINTIDPGFKTIFTKTNNGKSQIVADDNIMVYDQALATIEGYVDIDGQAIITVESNKLKVDEIIQIGSNPDDIESNYSHLKNIRFKVYYYIYNNGYNSKYQEAAIKKVTKTRGGIRLYRNGFRVLPYAETGDDWLKLDQSMKTRSILAPHSNSNFLGFAEIDDKNNFFEETSSREGLLENDSFIELQNFIYRSIITGILKVNSKRNIKTHGNQRRNEDGDWEEIEVRIKNIAHTIDDLDRVLEDENGSVEIKRKRKSQLKKIKDSFVQLEKIQKNEYHKMIKERSMLRVLSSVGLTVAQFIHEIKYYMLGIRSDIKYLIHALEKDEKLLKRLLILEKNFSSFHTYTSYFDDVISKNIIRDLKPLNLREIVPDFMKSISPDVTNSKIIFNEPTFNSYNIFTKSMHPSEWASILFNLYTNSKKAIKRTGVDGVLHIECGITENYIYLEFSDNGDGISKDIEERIFDEFFTTTSPQILDKIDSNNHILGTGLGLKIVKDIIKSYRGSIFVVSPKDDFNTCIRIEIPKATEKELEENAL